MLCLCIRLAFLCKNITVLQIIYYPRYFIYSGCNLFFNKSYSGHVTRLTFTIKLYDCFRWPILSNDKFFLRIYRLSLLVIGIFILMELNVGRIVWARRTKDDIYWPAKIMIISSNTSDSWSSTLVPNYHVHFFITNQTAWVTDLLPYQQYRDSMTNESFMNYGLHPTIKPDFINAIHQADYAISNEAYGNASNSMLMTIQSQNLIPAVEHNTNNDFLLATNSMTGTNMGKFSL